MTAAQRALEAYAFNRTRTIDLLDRILVVAQIDLKAVARRKSRAEALWYIPAGAQRPQ